MEDKTMEVQEAAQAKIVEKAPLKARIGNARPVRFVKRHVGAFAAGAAGAAAVAAAAVIAARSGMGVTEIADEVVDAVSDAVPIEE